MKIKSKNNWVYLVFLFSVFLFGCSDGSSDQTQVEGRNIALTVSGSRSFNPNIIHGQIDYYQITITAPDLNTPFVSRFGGDSESARMLGIPTGEDRTIFVEAFNPNGLIIRRGTKEGVSIRAGQLSRVEIVMHSVPIFTNITDRSAVTAERLDFKIFGEPGSRLEIAEEEGGSVTIIADEASGRSLVNTVSDEGLFVHTPAEEPSLGVHAFTVTDLDSGESSRVTVTLYETTARPGLVLNAGGNVRRQGNEMILSGAGQSYFRDVVPGVDHLGNETMLDVVTMIY